MKKLIIDTDLGVDDARAIITALKQPNVEVLAITTVFGNIPLDQATANVSRILRLCEKTEIAVYAGCAGPILPAKLSYSCEVHGADGLGDCAHLEPKLTPKDFDVACNKETAAEALVRLINQHPNEITLVCIAPLTNLAVALKLDPSLDEKLKALYIMGGNLYGIGNQEGTSTESNFRHDPEAAFIVLEQCQKCPITIVPWDVCIENGPLQQNLDPFDWHAHLDVDSRIGRFMHSVSLVVRNYCQQFDQHLTFVDDIALAAAINPEVVTKTLQIRPWIELSGTRTRGQVAIDWENNRDKGNVTFVLEYSRPALEKMVLHAFKD